MRLAPRRRRRRNRRPRLEFAFQEMIAFADSGPASQTPGFVEVVERLQCL
jgi:hypothetical protein